MPTNVVPVNLPWITTYSGTKNYIALDNVDLSKVVVEGVYMIYQLSTPTRAARVIRVGQGIVKDRLTSHAQDQKIGAHRASGALYVVWAPVAKNIRDGVERYLADVYQPLVGDAFPNVAPVAVSAPWAA